MKWKSTRRNYHSDEAPHNVRWIIHEEDSIKGICECYDEESAEKIKDALNNLESDYDGLSTL